MNNKEIFWDLSEIFPNMEDNSIKNRIIELKHQTEYYIENYKGKIKNAELTPHQLNIFFQEEEKFLADLYELIEYAMFLFTADMINSQIQNFYNKIEEFKSELVKELTFIDLELGKLFTDHPEYLISPELKNYYHLMQKIQKNYPHTLPEEQEQIIIEKDQYGISAWSQLQSKWLNTRKFIVEVEGIQKELSYGEANSLLTHNDNLTRISANKSIYGSLGKDEEIFSSALRNICNDWVKISQRRHYSTPMEQSILINDCEKSTIDNLMISIEKSTEIYQKYLKIKAELMKIPKLLCSDIVAPLPDIKSKKYSWKSVQEIIILAYKRFDEQFASIAEEMFIRQHIDASPRMGKTNGAFCNDWYKGKSAYILLTFTGDLDEIFTLAHEMGHAVHAYLSSQNQTLLNADPSPIIAETASIFGELLLTDLLLNQTESDQEKLLILTRILDNAGMAIFQVSARVWFETSLYDSISEGIFLDGKTIAKRWCAARNKIYGDSVEWFEEMNWEWTMKPHYFMPNFRYYNYPYVYAQLFVFSLYKIYKREGKTFVPKLKQLLIVGSSKSPYEAAKEIGIDVSTPDFWNLGLTQFEFFANEIAKLKKSKY